MIFATAPPIPFACAATSKLIFKKLTCMVGIKELRVVFLAGGSWGEGSPEPM